MTEKLYDYDAYKTEFTANVIECTKDGDKYIVVLDKTLFFPEEGGQSCDKGTINDIEVSHVKIKNDVIYHYISKEIPVGTVIDGKIDFAHRFSNMQMHSGEHIFTGLVHSEYGFNNVGFHLSDNSATMDYDGKLSAEELMELERKTNAVIFSNKNIKAYYPDKEELSKLQYRSKKEIDGAVRIVIVEDVDMCACCAPHVLKTGEIGIFKIVSYENYKGGIRVHYLCGYRALSYYDNRINELRKISNLLTCKEFTEADAVNKMYEENRNIKYDIVSLKNEIIEKKIRESVSECDKCALYIGDIAEVSSIKHSMEILHSICDGVCAVFCGDSDNGYRYLVEHIGGDLTELNLKLKNEFNAKGGGRKESLQGSVLISPEDIRALFK